MKTLFHLDLDAFFVSVERILDPSLIGKPVIVGADPTGRGVAAACSYEARKYGVHSGMPIRQAYRLCPQGCYIHGHYSEYVTYSHQVRSILEKYAPVLQQASIDEFYMDFTGCEKIYGPLFIFASKIQKEILDTLKLPSSIGIGSNKTIAKIASDFNKPKGITYVLHGKEKEFLSVLPVEVIPGVGKHMLEQLHLRGIRNIKDIFELPQDYLFTAFGKAGTDLWRKANGEGNDQIIISFEQKSISKETTFSTDVIERELLKKVLFELTGKVCQILRDNKFVTSTISIKLRYSDFQTLTRSKTADPTDDDNKVFNIAWGLLDKAYSRRAAVRLIGISLSNFSHYFKEESLFDDAEAKREKMIEAINGLRAKYGYDIIKIGEI